MSDKLYRMDSRIIHTRAVLMGKLKKVLQPYQEQSTVTVNQPDSYCLNVKGSDQLFAAVQIMSQYVALYLPATTMDPTILNKFSYLRLFYSGNGMFRITRSGKRLMDDVTQILPYCYSVMYLRQQNDATTDPY